MDALDAFVDVTTTEEGLIQGGSTTLPALTGGFGVSLGPLPLLKQTPLVTATYTVAYSVVFTLALVNNICVLVVILCNPQMRTVTNFFLANLAVADLIVTFIVLPITLLSNLFTEWIFSWFLCKTINYLQAVAVSASVNTLAAVAIERYCVIFFPATTIIRPARAVVIIALIWLIPLAVQTPWIYLQRLDYWKRDIGLVYSCYTSLANTQLVFGFVAGVVFGTCYILPLAVITIFYSMIGVKVCRRNVAGIRGSQTERNIQASKIRIVRMLVTVAVFFALSWLPLYSIKLRVMFGSTMQGSEREVVNLYLFPIFQWLGSANSCVNPFIYCFFSTQFRGSILTVLRRVVSAVFPCCCGSSGYESRWPQQRTKDTREASEPGRIDMAPMISNDQFSGQGSTPKREVM